MPVDVTSFVLVAHGVEAQCYGTYTAASPDIVR